MPSQCVRAAPHACLTPCSWRTLMRSSLVRLGHLPQQQLLLLRGRLQTWWQSLNDTSRCAAAGAAGGRIRTHDKLFLQQHTRLLVAAIPDVKCQDAGGAEPKQMQYPGNSPCSSCEVEEPASNHFCATCLRSIACPLQSCCSTKRSNLLWILCRAEHAAVAAWPCAAWCADAWSTASPHAGSNTQGTCAVGHDAFTHNISIAQHVTFGYAQPPWCADAWPTASPHAGSNAQGKCP
jgi:hypothetical protein